MRLIDAKKMIIKIPAELPERQRLRILNIIRKSIEQAPTVEAIPIEWMEKYADLNRFTTPDGQVIIRFRWIVDVMVADWREALEVQSNEDQGSC